VTEYLPRSGWTSTSAGGATLTGTELVGPALHWPGTGQSVIGVETKSQVASRLRGYRNFHVNTRGWADIGYNIAIDQAGRVWMLRSTTFAVNRVGAHCASASNPRANHKYVGVLLILGANEAPSVAMIEAFGDWYHRVFLGRWPGRTDARGHGKVPGASTSCQGPIVQARIADGTFTRQPSGGGSTGGGGNVVDPHTDGWAYKGREDRDAWSFLRGSESQARSANSRANTAVARATEARNAGNAALTAARANGEKLDALLAAHQGLDEQAILARIDQHHADTVVRLEAADTARDELAETLGGVAELLDQHASGNLDVTAVVEAFRDLLHRATAPAES
jgi:hypothetical protein